ncbi:hypothetical protein LX36DRAFT_319542 [Colletotrichum falcatum]|nr:hypothetical protein LX36DRAFT_319542 [Colletotrichum falcatum]
MTSGSYAAGPSQRPVASVAERTGKTSYGLLESFHGLSSSKPIATMTLDSTYVRIVCTDTSGPWAGLENLPVSRAAYPQLDSHVLARLPKPKPGYSTEPEPQRTTAPEPHWLPNKILSPLSDPQPQTHIGACGRTQHTVDFLSHDETSGPPPPPPFFLFFTSVCPSTEQQCAPPCLNTAICPVPGHDECCTSFLHNLLAHPLPRQ